MGLYNAQLYTMDSTLSNHQGRISIITAPSQSGMVSGEHNPREIAKFGAVLAGIIFVSLVLSSLYSSGSLEGWARWFMGVFFVVFACFKFAGYRMFAMMFASYDVVAKRVQTYAYAYPFIELALGILYLTDNIPIIRDTLTLLIMTVATIGVVQEIGRRSGVHCACLGNIIKLPLSTVSLVEDVGMALMALVMLLI